MSHTNDTIREIDALCKQIERRRDFEVDVDLAEVLAWLAKIRAHAEADELEIKSLGTRVLTGTGAHANRAHAKRSERVAALRAKANAMPPRRICGAPTEWSDVCQRAPGHSGKHCPLVACEVEHG